MVPGPGALLVVVLLGVQIVSAAVALFAPEGVLNRSLVREGLGPAKLRVFQREGLLHLRAALSSDVVEAARRHFETVVWAADASSRSKSRILASTGLTRAYH
eukprot:TRINITY_DN15477_c0_g1_i1.p2 TRINITY_DN15477_c0_g1~~TRINITY_DN15477_c0_g1_i1.p2  ORF type:complete len:102 (-),score=15.97 TRINITY_DN15477_c0_g1_i1:688-993(-)